MLISRGLQIVSPISRCAKAQKISINFQQVRFRQLAYRTFPPAKRINRYIAELIGGIMWWWVFWNMYHGKGHLIGHFPHVNLSDFTDEELGIPPDTEDI